MILLHQVHTGQIRPGLMCIHEHYSFQAVKRLGGGRNWDCTPGGRRTLNNVIRNLTYRFWPSALAPRWRPEAHSLQSGLT